MQSVGLLEHTTLGAHDFGTQNDTTWLYETTWHNLTYAAMHKFCACLIILEKIT